MTDTVVVAAATTETEAKPRVNRRQVAKARTRIKVLEAARNLFAERGYDAATIRDIAKGAGMSTGAVFANFQDKAELFEAVFSDEMAALSEAFTAGVAIEAGTSARLAGGLSAGYHQVLDHLPLMQAMVARSWFQPEDADKRVREFLAPVITTISDVLQAGIAKGELRQDTDVAMLSRMVWDIYLSNLRRAAFDNWGIEELTPHAAKQMDVVVAGQLAK
ncbi:TetR/AcrR family transcriptional regulator [Brevundimonas sp.]|uniref:TetR/AcrR family transcriptional regulator n=1 Tax=Brevundimonas sp. TaxID=1871086 RepID=UPI002FC6CF78